LVVVIAGCGNSSASSGETTGGSAGMGAASGAGNASASGGTTTESGGATSAGAGGGGGTTTESGGTSAAENGGAMAAGSAGRGGAAGSAQAAGGGAGLAGSAGNGSAGMGVCGHELDNPACWSSVNVYDLTRNEPGFFGGIFDGRRILFTNGTSGYYDYHLQLDTQGDFSGHGWETFNTSPMFDKGFRGGTFDGRYIYLTPTMPENNGAGGSNYDCIATRYDTQGDFTSNNAWASFNLTQKSGTADLTVPGYRGAAFDGRYVYFAPSFTGEMTSGNATRYDTMAAFDDAASWTDFDLTTVDPNAADFGGAVLAGKYLYFVPNGADSLATRYDTTATFDDKASWSTFDLKALDPNAFYYEGGVFDGRYLYFAPTQEKGFMSRYDTKAAFDDASSWSIFNPIGTDFIDSVASCGAAFDGTYVYFVPDGSSYLTRYDPAKPFDSPDAWFKYRMVSQYCGAVFDGRYLYLVPQGFGSIQRFDARAPDDPGPTQASFY
jgi:hypothetical protein